ncbi:GFA family protein [Neorhizobium sp. NPDC001467]|uniref:GFA family protein n=1 Tax=Neorhizobium sp. NPDC001467 TaxID=3390595 RepID=UPI003D034FFA
MTGRAYSGGCQCGAVRYRATGEIGFPHVCHCRMCQKAAGNYFMPFGGIGHENFTLMRGEPTWFQSSDSVRRGFCARCGTPLFYDGGSDHISITLGSLDDPESVRPALQTNLARKMPWFAELAVLPHDSSFDVSPSNDAGNDAGSRQHPDHDTADDARWPMVTKE